MPIYMDRHYLEGGTHQTLVTAHMKDLAIGVSTLCACGPRSDPGKRRGGRALYEREVAVFERGLHHAQRV